MSDASLSTTRPGDLVLVHRVDATPSRIDKLAALGILPGVELRVLQQRPVVVVECGETTLAL
jgi:Fe2+ transport system protein FeoA